MNAPEDTPGGNVDATFDAEFEAVAEAIAALGTRAVDRAALEGRVSRLCDAVLSRPAPEARALAPALERLIAALDEAASRLQAQGGQNDSPAPSRPAHAAAAAYGAGRNRGRGGF